VDMVTRNMPDPSSIAIYALTRQGLGLARRLAADLGGTTYAIRRLAQGPVRPFDSLSTLLADTFRKYDGHVFVAATGIVIRCISAYIGSKETDPAVVCLDQEGRFAVSLLSGHLGGANQLAVRCAKSAGGQAVVTTATDAAGVPSMDMLAVSRGLAMGNAGQVKVVNGALLDGRAIQVFDPDDRLGLAPGALFSPVRRPGDWENGRPGVWVSSREDCPDHAALRLYPGDLHLGMGCRRGIPADEILEHVRSVFSASGLALKSVVSFGSIEAKQDEAGLIEAARELGVEPVFFSKEAIKEVKVPTPSDRVERHMGVPSVAEAAALLLSEGGELIVPKQKTRNVTLAVAGRKRC